MFQLGSLVVLCSLLTGTSASLSEFIQKLDVPVNFSEKPEHQERTIENIVLPYDSMTLRRLNHSVYLNNMRNIFSGQRKRDLQAGLSSKDNGTEMEMPLIVDSSVYLHYNNPRRRGVFSNLLSFLSGTRSQKRGSYGTLWKRANETMKDITDSSGRQNAMMVILSTFLTERDSLAREIQFLSSLRILPRSGAPLQMLTQDILIDISV